MKKIAIHIHLYYINQALEFKAYLKKIKIKNKVVIITTTNKNFKSVKKIFKNEKVYAVANKGWDVAPFIYSLNKMKKLNIDLVLKIHTKGNKGSDESVVLPNFVRLKNANEWRIKQISCLVDNYKKIISCFKKNNSIGIIGSKYFLCKKPVNNNNIERNYKIIEKKFNLKKTNYKFFAGTMFWIRWEVCEKLIRKLSLEDFRKITLENVRKNNSLAHALEHNITNIVRSCGFNLKTIEELDKDNKELIKIFIRKIQGVLSLLLKYVYQKKVSKGKIRIKILKIPVYRKIINKK